MKKIMILGLMLAMTACSNEPEINMDDLVRDILFESIKGSFVAYDGSVPTFLDAAVDILTASGDFPGITSVEPTTIDTLNFSIPVNGSEKVAFEYVEVRDDAWLVYKVTYNGKVNYTALGSNLLGWVLTESNTLQTTLSAVNPTDKGAPFLVPTTKIITELTATDETLSKVVKASN